MATQSSKAVLLSWRITLDVEDACRLVKAGMLGKEHAYRFSQISAWAEVKQCSDTNIRQMAEHNVCDSPKRSLLIVMREIGRLPCMHERTLVAQYKPNLDV